MSRAAYKRLRIEQRSLEHDPPPFVVARPEEDDLLKWHFVLHGLPADTPYAGGVYHGMLIFPAEYPFRPPAIKIFTPNGRFAVNTRLCFSMSDYHPETWQVSWKVSTILTGFVSFMLDSADPSTTGSVQSSAAQRRALALSSFGHNISWPTFSRLFPEFSDASSFNPVHGYRLKQPSAPSSSSTSSSASSSSSSANGAGGTLGYVPQVRSRSQAPPAAAAAAVSGWATFARAARGFPSFVVALAGVALACLCLLFLHFASRDK
eukprot:GHVT01059773.1.p1 GENE.GHVT01059773.1~~GHVT01059773.1.p1  ORF type:complete len:263 (-),score=68.57 GHVT01059773.1:706-1494(-)